MRKIEPCKMDLENGRHSKKARQMKSAVVKYLCATTNTVYWSVRL